MTMPQSGLHTHPGATIDDAGVIELATNAEVIGGLDAERAVTPAGLDAWAEANPATETDRGLIELATDAEVIGGTDTERVVTPSGLDAWASANPATEADRGLIELASDAEVIAGTDTERAVTPSSLDAWTGANPATEADRGLIELATDAEVIAGTDTERAVTPSGLEAWSVEKGSNQYALYRATISSAFPCLSGATNITVPFTSLAVERGDSGGATLQSNMVVLNRPGLYLLRACAAFYNSVGVGRLQIRILDASGAEIGITMANSGNTDSTADLCPIVTDFRWCEAGTKILCEANYRGNASYSTVRSGYTNLAVTRIAD
jgi:hypothetical protein